MSLHTVRLYIIFFVYTNIQSTYSYSQSDIKDVICVEDVIQLDSTSMPYPYFLATNSVAFSNGYVFFIERLNYNSYRLHSRLLSDTKSKFRSKTLHLLDSIKIDPKHVILKLEMKGDTAFVFYQNFYVCFRFSLSSCLGIFYLDRNYEYFYVFNNYIIAAHTYNSSELPLNNRVYISRIKFFESKPDKLIYPKFDCVELSHFRPYNWVSCNDTYCIISNSNKYEICIYNHELEEMNSIVRTIPGWNKLNVDSIRTYNITTSDKILKNLSGTNTNIISKVEGVWLTTNNKILVRYYINNETDKGVLPIRYFDVYNLNQHSNQFILHKHNLKDGGLKLNVTDTIQPCNSYLLSWVESFNVINNYLCIVKPYYTNKYFGITLNEVFTLNKDLMKIGPPKNTLWLYKLSD